MIWEDAVFIIDENYHDIAVFSFSPFWKIVIWIYTTRCQYAVGKDREHFVKLKEFVFEIFQDKNCVLKFLKTLFQNSLFGIFPKSPKFVFSKTSEI